MHKKHIIAAVLGFGLAAGLAAGWLARRPPPAPAAATLFEAPRMLPDLALVDQRGAPLTPASFAGRWDVLFFGFTHCPDVCPTTLARLDQVLDQLEDIAPARLPQIWLVSVDPERDTAPVLDRYLRHFDERLQGITGTTGQIDRLATALGVAYARVPQPGGYTMDHTAALFLLDPDGHYAGVMTTPHDWDAIAADLRSLAR